MTDRIAKFVIRGDISDLKAKLAAGGQSVKSFVAQTTSAEKESVKWRKGLDQVAGSAGRVGLVAAAAFGAATFAAANFDQAMSNVAAATHESAANMDLLRSAAIEAGQATQFSATEAAGAIENLAKAGVSTADILGGGLDGALSLAAAGSLDVADAAEIAATALTQFKLSGEAVPHVADLLAAAAGKAQGEVSDMGQALNQSGLVAAQMGVSLEETTGTLAAFASAGLLGSDAGTSFKTMLLRLAKPSSDAAGLMDRLGIAAYDAQGNFVGIQSLAGQLQKAFEGQTQATRDAALATIFGSDAIRAANVLYDQGARGVQDWTAKVNDQGFAAETAAIKMDNLKGDIEKLTGSLETFLIGAGDGAQGPLRKLTQGAEGAVNALNGLPGPMKNTVSGMLAVTALTAGGLWFGSKVIRGVADTRSALGDLNISLRNTEGGLTRTGRAIKGMTIASAVITGLYALDAVLKNIGSDGKSADTVEELTTNLLDLADGKTQNLGKDFKDLGDSLDLLGSKSTGAVGSLESMIPVLPEIAEGLSGMLGFGDESVETRLAKASKQIETLDQALAGLVTSTSSAQAEKTFADLAKSTGLSADEQKRLLDLLPGYRDALAGVMNQTRLAGGAVEGLGGKAGKTQAQLDLMAKALEKSRKAADDTATSFFNVGPAVDDTKVSLAGWIKQMEDAAKALRDFRKNAETAADKGLRQGLIDALEEAGPAGALRMKQLANATKSEIARANRAWHAGQVEVDKYVDKIGGIPPVVKTTVVVSTWQAEARLDSLAFKIAHLPGIDRDAVPTKPGAGKASTSSRTPTGTKPVPRPDPGQLGRTERAAATATPPVINVSAPAAPATAPAVHAGPLVSIGTVRHNDMSETVKWARDTASVLSRGGESF